MTNAWSSEIAAGLRAAAAAAPEDPRAGSEDPVGQLTWFFAEPPLEHEDWLRVTEFQRGFDMTITGEVTNFSQEDFEVLESVVQKQIWESIWNHLNITELFPESVDYARGRPMQRAVKLERFYKLAHEMDAVRVSAPCGRYVGDAVYG